MILEGNHWKLPGPFGWGACILDKFAKVQQWVQCDLEDTGSVMLKTPTTSNYRLMQAGGSSEISRVFQGQLPPQSDRAVTEQWENSFNLTFVKRP